MKIVLVLLGLTISNFLFSQTPEAAQLRQKRVSLQKEMDELRQSRDNIRKNRKAGLRELAIMQKRISLRVENLKAINRQLQLIQGRINNSQYEIARLAGELDTLKEEYKKSLVNSYQYHNNLEFINFIFSANNFNDGLKRIEYLRTYRKFREEKAAAIRNTQHKLQQKIQGLQLSRRQKDEKLDEQENEIKLFAKDKREKDRLIASLRAREKELSKELAAKEKSDRKLRDAIAKTALRNKPAEKKAAAPGKRTITGGNSVAVEFERRRGKLSWPVEGKITERFGRYKIPGMDVYRYNMGITLETEPGADVKAVFDGEVSMVFPVDEYQAVIIVHGKYLTTYNNLSQVTVRAGQKISAGDVLGKAAPGDTRKGSIEFLITEGKTNLDPAQWLKRN